MKAWSQNLGHEGMLTTLASYGRIPLEQQRELIHDSGAVRDDNNLREKFLKLIG